MGLIEQVEALELTEEDLENMGIPTPFDFGVLSPVFIAPNEKGEDETWHFINEDKQREWLELILKKANDQ